MASNPPNLKIFISSPSDVRPERLVAARVVERLDREFQYHCRIEPVLWERLPLVATLHFQHPDNIPRPRTTDIVVVILWSRLGFPLPVPDFAGPVSEGQVTGTEWEFEDAWQAQRDNGSPDLLVYRKTSPALAGTVGDQAEERSRQKRMLDDFIFRWFHHADGNFSAASHQFAAPAQFEEMLEAHLRIKILERLQDVPDIHRARCLKGSPFRGLESFEPEHTQVFFGRNRARHELREALTRQTEAGRPFLLVMGASGSGKSSVVKAGLLPDLMLPGMLPGIGLVRHAVMRPSQAGGDPNASLVAALEAPEALPGLQHREPHALARAIADELERLATEAALVRADWRPLFVLVVDQLEEVFAQAVSASTRTRFIATLEALTLSGAAAVLATMRSDFFDKLETEPKLVELSAGDGRYLLLPPNDAEIGQMIVQPAQEAGISFEQHPKTAIPLNEELRLAAAGEPGVLPLLEFTLDQLWHRRTENGELTFAAYRELGELKGAIGKRAEGIFGELPAIVQRQLPAILRVLVTVSPGGRITSRPALLDSFVPGTPSRALVDALLDPLARLLVADGALVRVAHEALISHWDRAAKQIGDDVRDLELRGRLELAAGRWRAAVKKDRDSLLLSAGLPLAEALDLTRRWGLELPEDVRDFIAQSRIVVSRRKRRLMLALVAAVAAVPVISALVWGSMVWRGVQENEAEMLFAQVPAGCFVMGSPKSEPGRNRDEDQREVCPASFELGKFELTQGQWRRIMLFNPDPSRFKGDDRHPVEMISWDDAVMFTRLMSAFGHYRYRLPSEAEWEYAARGGTTTARFWGDAAENGCNYANLADRSMKAEDLDAEIADCDDGFGVTTAPVGSFRPNAFGLHDMLGNVWEWVADCYAADLSGAPKDGGALVQANCQRRILRGGSWSYYPRYLRAASRMPDIPDHRGNNFGFRMVRLKPL